MIEINSVQEFTNAINQDKLVLVDFSADWCGPCKVMKPVVETLDVEKYIVDVDKQKEIAQSCRISSLPTFHFYKNGKKLGEVVGADKNQLLATLTKLSSQSSTTSTANGYADLQPFISKQLECLNSDDKHPVSNIFQKEGVLKSDADEQLLITVYFNQPVKVFSLKLTAGKDGPKTIKTFINKTVSFDDVDDNPIDIITLKESDLEPDANPVNLKFVKYQNVFQISIFVQDNQSGEDVTVLDRLALYGTPIEATKDVK
ncbi:hypothetical protein HDV06_001031 [Boothiomyces sp. JEL0866]|nr:hypothetical protein HDV06_001031 [Boothiomyces sp. JEL0866]